MKKKLHRRKYFTGKIKKNMLLGFAVLLFCCSSIKGIAQQLGQWTFKNGSTTPGASANYGTIGVAASTNTPGGRRGAAKIVDKNGDLFLYGGSPADYGNFFGDLWKWDGTNWTWVNGSSSPDQPAVYGIKGVAAKTNTPGSRNGAMGWSDKNGNFWLFGGYINNSSITSMLNDLWKWDGTNWTWVSGSNLSGDQGNHGNYGTKGVAASTNQPPPRYYGCTWVDASGNVWLFGGASAAVQNCYNDLWKWDGTNWTWISGTNQIEDAGVYGTKGVAASGNQPRARFQASNWIDKNGNLWLFGGGNLNGAFNDLWKWDGTNWTWANGNPGTGAFANYGTLGVADPTSVPGSRMGSGAWIDKSNNLWLFGGSDGDGIYNDMWKWDGTNWAWMGGTSSSSIYGTQGVPSATNTPGSREADMGWTDKNGNFVIYGGWSYVDGYPPFLNDLWSFTPPTTSVLPLTLTNFTAAKQGNSALLDWNVAMEQSIDRYWIERSSDGITYYTVGSLASNGNSSISTNYSFIDSHPLEGAVYYRLRITEKDGKTSYSSIRLLNFGNAIKVAIYPNPVKTSVTITGLATGMTISFLNVIGQPVLSQKATNSTLEIKTGTIPAGIYGIRIVDTNGQIIFGGKLVKE